jgi:NAD(P)-dependent dehydrogenase (short-subunit alcohol dehydrogenase family)
MNQTIVITGCSSGFGYDLALTLARRGNRVYATMRGLTAGTQRRPARCATSPRPSRWTSASSTST